MNREIHVRICESLRGQFPRATRPPIESMNRGRRSTEFCQSGNHVQQGSAESS